jgi:hypothetical protein
VDQDIIHIGLHAMPKDILKGLINNPLEGGGGIGQAKGHNLECKSACWCVKGSQVFITRAHSDLVESISQVQFAKNPALGPSLKNIFNPWHGVSILNGLSVEGTVVYTHPLPPSLLLHKEDGGPKFRRAWGDLACLKQPIHLILNEGDFSRSVPTVSDGGGSCILSEFNDMVPPTSGRKVLGWWLED